MGRERGGEDSSLKKSIRGDITAEAKKKRKGWSRKGEARGCIRSMVWNDLRFWGKFTAQ